jgi:hypothetical protein
VTEWFWLADTLGGVSQHVVDQTVQTSEGGPISVLPVPVVIPST